MPGEVAGLPATTAADAADLVVRDHRKGALRLDERCGRSTATAIHRVSSLWGSVQ